MPNWDYESKYPTNPKPPDVELPRNVKVGDADGPDILAYKAAISRGGRWPWPANGRAGFDDTYSKGFANGKSGGNVGDSGVKGFQRQANLDDDGEIGPQTFEAMRVALIPSGLPHAGEPLFDSVCINQLKDAAHSPAPGGGAAALADYARRSINSEPKIHYSQARPMTHLGVPPEEGFTADCSGHSTSCYYEAGWPDPNKANFNGSGWTGTLSNNPKVGAPYQVGDLGLYGTSWGGGSTHVVTCYIAGDAPTAVWVSHGSEQAPYPVSLYYRSDMLGVVRPPKS
jgi:hypothetical protein